jgi:hypothetical protein
MKLGNRITIITFFLGTTAFAQSQPTARGIYLGGTKLGVSTEIEIERDGHRGMVPANFEFKTGDRFWLHVTVNQDSYIYVLNRTLTGTPAQVTRGVKLMGEADRKAKTPPADTYTLVFPAPNTSARLVKAGAPTKIPGGGQYFGMDQVPGAEKLLVIASPAPLPLSSAYFNGPGGKLVRSAKTADTAEGVLGRLNAELAQMADNTETQEPPKTRGIQIVPNPFPGTGSGPVGKPEEKKTATPPDRRTYAASRQPGKPMLLDLTLLHLGK